MGSGTAEEKTMDIPGCPQISALLFCMLINEVYTHMKTENKTHIGKSSVSLKCLLNSTSNSKSVAMIVET